MVTTTRLQLGTEAAVTHAYEAEPTLVCPLGAVLFATTLGGQVVTAPIFMGYGSAVYLARLRDSVMRGRVFEEDSADLLREARRERNEHL